MTRTMSLTCAVVAALALWWPQAGAALTCDLRLSELEAATAELEDTLEDVVDSLADQYRQFARLERRAVAQYDDCPDLSASRAEAVDLPATAAAAQGERLLTCGQFFTMRVQIDIERATEGSDSQLVIRLTDLQKRILAVQQKATDLAVEAEFLGLRQARLVAEHDLLSNRCTTLSDIYD